MCWKNLCQRALLDRWGFGEWFSHCKSTTAHLLSCNYLEKTVQTDLPDLLTLSCQHTVRSQPVYVPKIPILSLLFCSVSQWKQPEGQNIQQGVEELHCLIEKLGATKTGLFLVECESFQNATSMFYSVMVNGVEVKFSALYINSAELL